MPIGLDLIRSRFYSTSSVSATINVGAEQFVDTAAEESQFFPFTHSAFTPVFFVVSGCTLTANNVNISTNLLNGFTNIRAGDLVSLSTPGGATMAATTVASVISSTQITVTTAPTVAGSANGSGLTFTPLVANCTLVTTSTSVTSTTANAFDRIQIGDAVSINSGTGTLSAGTTVIAIPSVNSIVLSAIPTAAGTATLSFSTNIGGCTIASGANPTVTTTVPGGFSRVRPGDTVTLVTANGAALSGGNAVTSVVNSTTIVLSGSASSGTTGGQFSTISFTPVSITPPIWGIRLLYQRSGTLVTIRPTFYLYDGTVGNATGTVANAVTAINLFDGAGAIPTIDLDAFYNSARLPRAL